MLSTNFCGWPDGNFSRLHHCFQNYPDVDGQIHFAPVGRWRIPRITGGSWLYQHDYGLHGLTGTEPPDMAKKNRFTAGQNRVFSKNCPHSKLENRKPPKSWTPLTKGETFACGLEQCQVESDSQAVDVWLSCVGVPVRSNSQLGPQNSSARILLIVFSKHKSGPRKIWTIKCHQPASPGACIFQLLLPNYGLLVGQVAGKK